MSVSLDVPIPPSTTLKRGYKHCSGATGNWTTTTLLRSRTRTGYSRGAPEGTSLSSQSRLATHCRLPHTGQVIYWVKGSVRVLFWILHSRGERGRKGRECKFLNKAHSTFDPGNTLSLVLLLFTSPSIIRSFGGFSLPGVPPPSDFRLLRRARREADVCERAHLHQVQLPRHVGTSKGDLSPVFLADICIGRFSGNKSL